MPLRMDDVKVGMYIAITGVVKHEEEDYLKLEHFTFQMMPMRRQDRRHRMDGIPLEVLAVSLPFLCVDDGANRFGLDTRDLVFTKLDKEFVDEMRHGSTTANPYNDERKPPRSVRRKIKREKNKLVKDTKNNPAACPRCYNQKTSQIRHGDGKWYRHCSQCGLDRPMDDGQGSPVQE